MASLEAVFFSGSGMLGNEKLKEPAKSIYFLRPSKYVSAMPGDISFNLAHCFSRNTSESEPVRILCGVVKSLKKKLTPMAGGRIELFCAHVICAIDIIRVDKTRNFLIKVAWFNPNKNKGSRLN